MLMKYWLEKLTRLFSATRPNHIKSMLRSGSLPSAGPVSKASVSRPAIHGLVREIAVPMSSSSRIKNNVCSLGLTNVRRAEYFIAALLLKLFCYVVVQDSHISTDIQQKNMGQN